MKITTALRVFLCLSAVTITASPAFARLRLACSAYTFGQGGATTYDAIDKAAAAGTHYIEIIAFHKLGHKDSTTMLKLSDKQIAELRAYAESKSVKMISLYMDIPSNPEEARTRFEYAKKLGVENITTESYAQIALIESLTREFDISVAFHTHARQPNNPGYWEWNPDYVYGFLQYRDPHVGVCAETGHWSTSGVVSLDKVKLLKGRIKSLHLKDRSELGRHTPDLIYGTGVNRIDEILRQLAVNDPNAIIVIEYESHPNDNLEEVRRCVEFVHKTLPTSSVL